MDYNLPGSFVQEISQARILEWVAISFQGIFPSQGSNLCLLLGRLIPYHWATRETWSNSLGYEIRAWERASKGKNPRCLPTSKVPEMPPGIILVLWFWWWGCFHEQSYVLRKWLDFPEIPCGSESKESPTMWKIEIQSLAWGDPLEKGTATSPVFLPGESHGQSLEGYSPWGCKELDVI